jgi:hypothetical protein
MRAQKSPKGLLTALQPQLACESEAQKAGEEVHLSLRTELLGALWWGLAAGAMRGPRTSSPASYQTWRPFIPNTHQR